MRFIRYSLFSKKIKVNLDKRDDIIHLEPISDIHIGHAGFDEDLYKKKNQGNM